MSSDTSDTVTDVIFRPWDSESETKHKKNEFLNRSESSASGEQVMNNNRRFLLRRPKSEPSELVTSFMSAAVTPQPIHPLTIAMRGLVPDTCLPSHVSLSDTCLPSHVSLSDTCLPSHVSHMMQVRAVHQLQELQMAVASVAVDKKIRPKKYKCDKCNACFSNNGQLRGHVRIHTGIFDGRKYFYGLFELKVMCYF